MTHVFRRVEWGMGGVIPDRPLQAGKIRVPKGIAMQRGAIVWNGSHGSRQIPLGAGMLDSFVRLHTAPDEAILEFAKKWGTMFFCEHGMPCSHSYAQDIALDFYDRMIPICEPLKTGLLNTDPIKYWRKWSAIASAILDLAAELNQNRIGGRNEWRIVSIYHMHGEKPNDALYNNVKKHGLEGARWALNLHLTAWVRFGEVLPLMRWSENHKEWEITLGSRRDSLFGAIGLALMMAVAEKPGLAICSSCHKSYAPGRRPNPHRRNYCETCGKRAAWRDAASQRRKRLREQGQSPV